MIQRIFEQGNTANNYVTFILGRGGASGPPVQGYFSIGEPIPGFENITSMPKLDVETVSRLLPSGKYIINVSVRANANNFIDT